MLFSISFLFFPPLSIYHIFTHLLNIYIVVGTQYGEWRTDTDNKTEKKILERQLFGNRIIQVSLFSIICLIIIFSLIYGFKITLLLA